MLTIVKMIKYKSEPFEHAENMSKWPSGSMYIGNIFYYLTHLTDTFPKGLEVDLKGSSTFPTLMLSIHIYRLGLLSYL